MLPNPAQESAPDRADIAVARVWDAARTALMARHIAGLAITSGAADEQIEQATSNMTDAFNSLLIAVREFDASVPLLPNDAPSAAACRLLQS